MKNSLAGGRKTAVPKADRETQTSSPIRALALPAALILWTLFVWLGRIRNVANDDALLGWSQLWRAGLALSFVALALVGVATGARVVVQKSFAADSTPMVWFRRVMAALASYGIGVWAVRGLDIVLGDHAAPFKLVHTVLAAITIGLGIVVLRRFVGWADDGASA